MSGGRTLDRALLLVPDPAERGIVADVLAALGIEVVLCGDVAHLAATLEQRVALVLADATTLSRAGVAPFVAAIAALPEWCDCATLLLTGHAAAPEQDDATLDATVDALGDRLPRLAVLQRPLRASLVRAAARAALRSRTRARGAHADRLAVAASAASLDFALDAGQLGVWEFDPAASGLRASNRFKAIFGRLPEEVFEHRDMLGSIHAEDRALVPAAIAATLGQGARYEVACRIVWPDGSEHRVEIRGRVIESPDGARVLSGTLLDVTDRTRSRDDLEALVAERTAALEAAMAQRERAEAALRQSQKMEAVGQLTGGIAHDFNNLLQVMSSGLQLFDRPGPPERRQRLLDAMRQATERGAQLTRQLLAFSRRQELRPEVVDLAEHLAGMRDLLERSLRGDIRIKLATAPDLWPIEVDPTQLELAVLNLAVNARDAMPGGGVLSITAHNVAGWREGGLAGDFVRLALEDTGIGMEADVLARAFEPFFTTKEVGSGTGLGLPQVYGFASQSRGAARIESVPGEGTTVVLMLPRASDPAPAAREAGASAGAGPESAAEPGTTVLLVEDDDRVAEIAAEMLRQLGYSFIRVRTGPAALGVLGKSQRVDVLFSDILMPGGMNGAELAEEVLRRRPGMPIVLATGFGEQVIAETQAGGLPLLRKPYRLDTLAEALRAALGEERAPR